MGTGDCSADFPSKDFDRKIQRNWLALEITITIIIALVERSGLVSNELKVHNTQ